MIFKTRRNYFINQKSPSKMKRITLTLGSLLLCLVTFAQAPTAILTIFSEDGHKFFLTLNGQKQNDRPETSIRVEGLAQQYYNCKIIFEDQSLGELNKSYLGVVDGTQQPMDVTYKIKAGKDGKQVLRYFSGNPIAAGAPPARPADVPVYTSGNTTPIAGGTTTVTQVTTTQTTNPSGSVTINGMGMNVNMPAGAVVTETTTTTTTTSNSNSVSGNMPPAASNTSGCNGNPMAPGDFHSAKETIKNASFEDSKMSTAKQISDANCLYADQVAEMCRLFGFENTKLTFAKYAYKRTIDPQNYFKVNNVFDFDASKTELSKYTGH
jgi:hypothetical protein